MELRDRISQARRVYLLGNGGSAANAAHIASDLLACGIRAFVIDPANLTRLANDFGWNDVFARWLRVVGEPGDLLIALSGSGTSPNILRAVAEAERLGMEVWREFGAAQGLDMQAAEERQIWLGHRVRALLGGAAFPPNKARETPHPWTDFLAARCRVIGWMHDEGKADADIAAALSMYDVTQVTLLRMTARPASVHQEDPCLRCGQRHPFERCADERATAAATPLIAQLRVSDVE